MAWSSFAHLPTNENEYWSILSQLRNGMSTKEVDNIIARYKGKENISHHYRSNLAKLGLFDIHHGQIILNYNLQKLLDDRNTLATILKDTVDRNEAAEIHCIAQIISRIKSYNLKSIADILIEEHPYFDKANLIRWIRPIVFLIEFTDIQPVPEDVWEYENRKAKYLQESYLTVAQKFENIVPLELIEIELKKIDNSFNLANLLDELLNNVNFRFRIELLMLPSWATKSKSYKIGQDVYTHIKIKSKLSEEA